MICLQKTTIDFIKILFRHQNLPSGSLKPCRCTSLRRPTTKGPMVILGTNYPSMTSKCNQSPPPFSMAFTYRIYIRVTYCIYSLFLMLYSTWLLVNRLGTLQSKLVVSTSSVHGILFSNTPANYNTGYTEWSITRDVS